MNLDIDAATRWEVLSDELKRLEAGAERQRFANNHNVLLLFLRHRLNDLQSENQ